MMDGTARIEDGKVAVTCNGDGVHPIRGISLEGLCEFIPTGVNPCIRKSSCNVERF